MIARGTVSPRIAAAHDDLVSAYHYPVISNCCIELIFGLSVVIVTHRSHRRTTIDKVIILLLFGLVLLIFHMFSRRRTDATATVRILSGQHTPEDNIKGIEFPDYCDHLWDFTLSQIFETNDNQQNWELGFVFARAKEKTEIEHMFSCLQCKFCVSLPSFN